MSQKNVLRLEGRARGELVLLQMCPIRTRPLVQMLGTLQRIIWLPANVKSGNGNSLLLKYPSLGLELEPVWPKKTRARVHTHH